MGPKTLRLSVARRLIVEIIEARFANSHDLWMLSQANQFFATYAQLLSGIVRMGSNRTEYIVKFLCYGKHLGEFAHTGGNGHHKTNAN